MRIIEFQLNNYKCFLKTDALLFTTGFNVVVGPNNVGKTALLEGLKLQVPFNPHKSLASMPRVTTQLNPITGATFTISITGPELRDELIAQARFSIPVPRNQAQNSSGANQYLAELLESQSLHLKLAYKSYANGATFELVQFPILQGVEPISDSIGAIFYRFTTREDKSGFEFMDMAKENPGSDILFPIAQKLSGRLYAFRAERLTLTEAAFGSNAALQTDARNLAETLHLMQTTQPAKFYRLIELTRQVFPGVAQISVRPKHGAGNIQEIILWNEEKATGRSDLAFTLNESGTGVGQVLALFYFVLHSDQPQVVIIDEPNSFLHPAASRKVIEILKDFPHNQYIISTHSPELIRAASPEKILLLEKRGPTTEVFQLDANSISGQQQCLSALGARLSDVFGADSVLWVEGATEEACFPEILRKEGLLKEEHEVLAVLPVRSPSELQQQKRKKLDLVLDLYRKLTTHNSLIPRTYGFVFDAEGLSDTDQADLTRSSGGLVHFMPRRMLENYFLVPEAIAHGINQTPSMASHPVRTESVSAWLIDHGLDAKFFPGTSAPPKQFSHDWKRKVHGANLLDSMYWELSNGVERYDKTRDGPILTNYILTEARAELAEVSALLAQLLKR